MVASSFSLSLAAVVVVVVSASVTVAVSVSTGWTELKVSVSPGRTGMVASSFSLSLAAVVSVSAGVSVSGKLDLMNLKFFNTFDALTASMKETPGVLDSVTFRVAVVVTSGNRDTRVPMGNEFKHGNSKVAHLLSLSHTVVPSLNSTTVERQM
jgi:hypothetical protein